MWNVKLSIRCCDIRKDFRLENLVIIADTFNQGSLKLRWILYEPKPVKFVGFL